MSAIGQTQEAARVRATPLPVTRVLAAAGLATALAASAWLVLAAAQRDSVLSPPTMRVLGQTWLLGPLHGLMPGLSADPQRLHTDFTIAVIVLAAGWLVSWAAAPALPLRVVAGAAGVAQLLFVLGPPQPLTDVFNYVVYGHMLVHGVNPYTHVPADAPSGIAYLLSNWHHLKSPYGPLFTLLSAPLGLLSASGALLLWKAIVLSCALGALALTARLASMLGRSPQRAVACVGLCPLTLAYGVGGLHNDLPAIVCVLGAVVCLLRGRDGDARLDAAAGALVVAAAAFKPSFAVAVPLVVLGARRRLVAAAAATAAAAAAGLLVATVFGGALPGVGTQSRLVNPLSLPNLVGIAIGHHGADPQVRAIARDLLAAAVAAGCLAVALRRRLVLAALGLVLFAAVLALPWVMPWYLAWLLPFAALGTPRLLAPLAVAMGVWLGVGASPQIAQIIHHFGYFPTRTVTGRANHDYLEGLLQ